MALSKKPLSGMRQRLPEDFKVEKFVTDTLRNNSCNAGFDEYDGPIIEPFALFAAKSGGELAGKQSYCFTDRGGREVILRPEMTPSLARMIASQGELNLPVRWFSLPLCFRYERPQRGRVREFLQYNCDILGTESLVAELEIILVLQSIMDSFKAPPPIYKIGWSSRRFMADALSKCGVSIEEQPKVFSAIDKRDKMKPGNWDNFLLEACSNNSQTASNITQLVNVKNLDDVWLCKLMGTSDSFEEIKAFDILLQGAGITSAVFSPGVVRGLDYYTGIVFELVDTGGENNRALCGGGRYDNLVGLFGKQQISGVGFGLGVLTLTLFLETYNLVPASVIESSVADIYIAVANLDAASTAGAIALQLRNSGLRVMLDVSGKKQAKQFAEASRKTIPFLLVVESNMNKNSTFKLKKLRDSSVIEGTLEFIINWIGGQS